MSEWARECRRACLACHEACLRAAAYLQASEANVAHVRLLFNTADIANTTASLLRGDLDVAEHAGRACVELCERAARYCDSLPEDAHDAGVRRGLPRLRRGVPAHGERRRGDPDVRPGPPPWERARHEAGPGLRYRT